ncbi:HNH endonuclease [Streptomyces sp. 5-10]|nr:HNH endonuclease [Streptomyces sp. 5-10]
MVTWVLAGLATLSLVSCSSETKQQEAQNKTLPAGVHQGPLREAIGELKVANEGSRLGYSRDKFNIWADSDGDGCNTRKEVLLAEAVRKPKIAQPGCRLQGGKWLSWFDNKSITNASGISIDHLVPLAEAWRSGASKWSSEKLAKLGNDTSYAPTLTAVTPEVNAEKGDADPASWLPPNRDAVCAYAGSWVAVKLHYGLTADPSEVAALKGLKKCQDQGMQWKGA